MESNNLSFTIAVWLARANAAFSFLSVIYLPYLVIGSPSTRIYIQSIYIIFAFVSVYLFIILRNLLRRNKLGNVSWDIYLIVIFNLVNTISGQLMYTFYSGLSLSSHPELGLLFLCYMLLRIIFGFIVIRFANKLQKHKDKTNFLVSYPSWIKVSGVLYMISGFIAGNAIFAVVADIIMFIILSSLFSKAAKETGSSFTEAENSSTH